MSPVRSAASSSVPSSASTNLAHALSIRSKAPLMPNSTSGHAGARPSPTNKSAALERYHISPGASTSAWLWRRDLDLLRALYRGQPGGFSVHIRAAVAAMCNHLRDELCRTPAGRSLLARLDQLDPPAEPPNDL